ncbi:MAG: hypothetical protein H8E56_10050 [Candidatus Marinimicrobia bacterium]|nr:hypothetical protein [Candidatus Neomarinimicrobiota bacterium]
MHPAIDWQKELSIEPNSNTLKWDSIYGNNPTLIQERKSAFLQLVERFYKAYGEDRTVNISRVPGRVNLMGRHIDHQGGFINTVAINKEILLAFSPREDSNIQIHNMDADSFPPQLLYPQSALDISSFSNWVSFATSEKVIEFNKQNSGNWSLYLLAIFYRLQLQFNHIELKGVDCYVSGNIPVGSGLSSSSALGVAFAKALIHRNQIEISNQLLIELTGESELFVGFMGGMGDQAAIISAKQGMINKIGFFPFHVSDISPFSEDLKLVIAFSGSSAKKGGAVQGMYNQRVASYAIGFKMLQQIWEPAKLVNHVRDLTPNRLNKTTHEILEALNQLPVYPTREDIIDFFDGRETPYLERLFQSHNDPGEYNVIGTLLFRIAECTRSESFSEILKSNQIEKIKSIISASHNGDRVNGHNSPSIEKANEQNISMMNIPGNYGCSTENIDQMVDVANAVPGVVGAQLAGAGMGGNIVILVKKDSAEDVLTELKHNYYNRNNIPLDAHICVPISGASIMEES